MMAKLEAVRRSKLLTQRELAQKAKVAKSTVYLIEAGEHNPRLSIIRRLSEALGVEPTEIDEFRAVISGKTDAA